MILYDKYSLNIFFFGVKTVTPLNEECGLLEWVENTQGLRNILLTIYKEKNLASQMKHPRNYIVPANASIEFVNM